ncbi:MAG: restriction endonuclease [Lachnospiraceae bacterium]|nr:restriction endonuclease [Lachnospiraceae bacterium]
MAIPRHNEIYREVLLAVEDGSEHKISEIRDFVALAKNINDDERRIMLKSGARPMFDDRVGWSRTYLKAAGLVKYPKRGITQITDSGKEALQHSGPVNDDYLMQFASFCNFVGKSSSTETHTDTSSNQSTSDSTPQESIETAFSQMNSTLSDELLTEIMNHEPKFFEKLVVDLLLKMGYGGILEDAGTVTPLSHDDGIDGIIREDKLGFSNIYIQAKRYEPDKTVNKPDIQKFVGAIVHKGGRGLFITTAKFSEGAKSYANESHIVLVDGERLAELMIEYKLGVSVVQTFEIKKMDSDYFSEE